MGSTVSAPAGKMTRRTVPAKRAPLSRTAQVAKQTPPVPQANGASPFEIMAGRIANRVAEMAENVTFVERRHQETATKTGNPTPQLRNRRCQILSTLPRQHAREDVGAAESHVEDGE